MKYGDEEIISLLNEYKKGQYGNIYDGVYIKEDLYHFKRRSLFDGALHIMLPLRFQRMDKETARLYYMSMEPDIIYKNRKSTIRLSFSYAKNDFTNNEVEENLELFKQTMKRIHPGTLIFEKKVESVNDITLGWIDFKSESLTKSIYNMFFLMPISNRLMHGNFVCDYKDSTLWKPVFIEMLHSIKTMEDIDDAF